MRKIIVIWMATTILAGIFLTAFPGNAEAKMCSHCDGTGECPTCGGDGSVWLEPCEACEGGGDCQKWGGMARYSVIQHQVSKRCSL